MRRHSTRLMAYCSIHRILTLGIQPKGADSKGCGPCQGRLTGIISWFQLQKRQSGAPGGKSWVPEMRSTVFQDIYIYNIYIYMIYIDLWWCVERYNFWASQDHGAIVWAAPHPPNINFPEVAWVPGLSFIARSTLIRHSSHNNHIW